MVDISSEEKRKVLIQKLEIVKNIIKLYTGGKEDETMYSHT